MKQFLLLFVCLLASSSYIFAQSCTYTSTNSQGFCTPCSGTYSNTNGSLTGDIYINIPGTGNNANKKFSFPTNCGERTLTIGALNLRVGESETVTISDFSGNMLVGLTVNEQAKAFTLTGDANDSRLIFRGITFKKNAPTNNFRDAEAAIRAEAQELPVNLYYWAARVESAKVALKWATTSETDNDYYIIEHSTDGRSFTEIAQVDGEGFSDGIVEYSYVDANPSEGLNLYRLSQVDFDGTRTDYPVRSASIGENTSASLTALYPNPARAGQRVTFQAPANVDEVVLHSITGREIKRSAATIGTLDLPAALPAGIYVLRAGAVSTRLLVR
ncbi:T9SS type A sorting domain-containing protein [Neolewinella litorea]|uniref:T9SS type A sorting domain-containing protein n=1 Tax=Neolewinella litorea TaxID=2562452 RepID=A0A4S4NKM3_9BACT|nr:T9SS type A sorting domain-containing protein [Neolewinella litorea]